MPCHKIATWPKIQEMCRTRYPDVEINKVHLEATVLAWRMGEAEVLTFEKEDEIAECALQRVVEAAAMVAAQWAVTDIHHVAAKEAVKAVALEAASAALRKICHEAAMTTLEEVAAKVAICELHHAANGSLSYGPGQCLSYI